MFFNLFLQRIKELFLVFFMFKKVKVVFLFFIFAVLELGCSAKNQDIIPDKTPEELYFKASEALSVDNFQAAREHLEAIDSRYPFGSYARQVQLDLVYTYYKEYENDLAIAEIDKYIRLNPSDENIDYLLYMRGLTNMQKGTDRFLDFLHIDRYDRDISYYDSAFKDFERLIKNYPNSLYAADAHARMLFIRNQIARHEFDIAKFYYRKGAYLSSARRCQKIILQFKDSEQLEDAMILLAKNYNELGLKDMEDRATKLLKVNFD